MKQLGLITISTGVLLLLLGTVAPTYAQQDQHEPEAKPQKQGQQQAKGQQDQQRKQEQQQAKGHQDQQRKQEQKHAKGQQDQQRRQEQASQPSQHEQQGQRGEQRAAWQDHRAHNWKSEHRDWQQRGGYNGYRIPEDRYRGYFGPDHGFHISRYPVMVVGGYPRFQYGGFWFGVVDPWPEYWSDGWYDNDDVYIEYSGDGYYMYNRRYPRDRIAISVYVH